MKQVEVPALRYQELASRDAGESSSVIRQRVNVARSIQLARFQKKGLHANAQMGTRDIKKYCAVKPEAEKLRERFKGSRGLIRSRIFAGCGAPVPWFPDRDGTPAAKAPAWA